MTNATRNREDTMYMNRDEAKRRIRTALETITGRKWSVTQGRGTASGWLRIHVFPRERGDFGKMPADAQETLRDALGLTNYHLGSGYSIDPRDRAGLVERLEARVEEKAGPRLPSGRAPEDVEANRDDRRAELMARLDDAVADEDWFRVSATADRLRMLDAGADA